MEHLAQKVCGSMWTGQVNTVFKTKQTWETSCPRRRVLCTATTWKSSVFPVEKHSMGNGNKSFYHTASLKCLFSNRKDNSEGSGKIRSCPPCLEVLTPAQSHIWRQQPSGEQRWDYSYRFDAVVYKGSVQLQAAETSITHSRSLTRGSLRPSGTLNTQQSRGMFLFTTTYSLYV